MKRVRRSNVILATAAAILAAAGALLGYAAWRGYQSRDVRGSSSVEFATTIAPPAPARPNAPWPRYGYDLAGTRSAPYRVRPPFRRVWLFDWSPTLLEFPPAVAYQHLYLPTWDGHFYALDAATGHVDWMHDSGRCGWGTPAVWRGLVITTYIGHKCNSPIPGTDGEVVAYAVGSGAERWRFRLGPCESSPLVVDGLVYVGDWHGNVYALNVATGRPRWRFHAGGAVKGSLSFSGGRVFIGAYDGHVYALDARTGKLVWRASAPTGLGHSSWFYSSPAVAHGRVYIGSTDSKVYSFGAQTGKLRWSSSTGGYVYASPAVWRDLILIGSYDHVFYAFDAATGAVRWRFRTDGSISGSASLVDGIVYFSNGSHHTYGLDPRNGRVIWRFPAGEYTPVVADRHRLYVVGYRLVYGLAPRR